MKRDLTIVIIAIVLIIGGVLLFKKKDDNEIKNLYYEATLNDNMINYNVMIIDEASLNSDLYSDDGEWLSEIKDGIAIVNEGDIKDYPDFKIKINDKTYIVKKK